MRVMSLSPARSELEVSHTIGSMSDGKSAIRSIKGSDEDTLQISPACGGGGGGGTLGGGGGGGHVSATAEIRSSVPWYRTEPERKSEHPAWTASSTSPQSALQVAGRPDEQSSPCRSVCERRIAEHGSGCGAYRLIAAPVHDLLEGVVEHDHVSAHRGCRSSQLPIPFARRQSVPRNPEHIVDNCADHMAQISG